MSHEVSSPPAARSTAPPAAKSGSAVRLLILLALLALVVGMWYYDYAYAGPGSEKGYQDIHTLVDKRNEMSALEGGLVRSKDIQEQLGFAPTYTDKQKDHTVEYYCWWGPIPGLNTWKRYVTVLYVGDEPRRFNAHYKNARPPAEDLPGYVPPVDPNAVTSEPAMEGGMGPGGEPSPEGAEGDAPEGKKKKGKGRGGKAQDAGEATPGEADADKAAGTDTTEKPADSDKPADSEEPADEKAKATDSPG